MAYCFYSNCIGDVVFVLYESSPSSVCLCSAPYDQMTLQVRKADQKDVARCRLGPDVAPLNAPCGTWQRPAVSRSGCISSKALTYSVRTTAEVPRLLITSCTVLGTAPNREHFLKQNTVSCPKI